MVGQKQYDDDESLVARVQKGDRRAFAVLVERYSQMFYAAAYRICGRVDDAEDIVQEAFLKFWSKPGLMILRKVPSLQPGFTV